MYTLLMHAITARCHYETQEQITGACIGSRVNKHFATQEPPISTQLSVGAYLAQIWSRYHPALEARKPSQPTVWIRLIQWISRLISVPHQPEHPCDARCVECGGTVGRYRPASGLKNALRRTGPPRDGQARLGTDKPASGQTRGVGVPG